MRSVVSVSVVWRQLSAVSGQSQLKADYRLLDTRDL